MLDPLTDEVLAELERIHAEQWRGVTACVPALLAEVRLARKLLSAPRWSGVITSLNGEPVTRIGPGGYSVPEADQEPDAAFTTVGGIAAVHGTLVRDNKRLREIASVMLGALEKGCTCGSQAYLTKEERAQVIAAARAAGIEPPHEGAASLDEVKMLSVKLSREELEKRYPRAPHK
jgi:hypothetical protein